MDRHPQFPRLESYWDNKHRGRLITDDGEVSVVYYFFTDFVNMFYRLGLIFLYHCCITQRLLPLRIHTHSPLSWDEQYAPFIRRAGFLQLTRLMSAHLSLMDSAALTALVDRWRPETHTFHLLCGEITVTLQDVTMILGLPIDGAPVSGTVSLAGWRDSVVATIGLRPPNVPADQKDRKTICVHSGWLTAHFDTCSEDAEDGAVQRYARSCLLLYE
jgi:hypothetical protein